MKSSLIGNIYKCLKYLKVAEIEHSRDCRTEQTIIYPSPSDPSKLRKENWLITIPIEYKSHNVIIRILRSIFYQILTEWIVRMIK